MYSVHVCCLLTTLYNMVSRSHAQYYVQQTLHQRAIPVSDPFHERNLVGHASMMLHSQRTCTCTCNLPPNGFLSGQELGTDISLWYHQQPKITYCASILSSLLWYRLGVL